MGLITTRVPARSRGSADAACRRPPSAPLLPHPGLRRRRGYGRPPRRRPCRLGAAILDFLLDAGGALMTLPAQIDVPAFFGENRCELLVARRAGVEMVDRLRPAFAGGDLTSSAVERDDREDDARMIGHAMGS